MIDSEEQKIGTGSIGQGILLPSGSIRALKLYIYTNLIERRI